jgi:hypothetical protein
MYKNKQHVIEPEFGRGNCWILGKFLIKPSEKMKSKVKTTVGLGVLLLTVATGNLFAQETNLITITATAQFQGPITSDGPTTTMAPPADRSFNTKQILAFMAIDENAEGNYGETNFPTGAKLVEIDGGSNADYQVLDEHDNYLADVSDVLNIDHLTNQIFIGKISNLTGLNAPTVTDKYFVRYGYYDLGISGGAGLEFSLQGLASRTITDSSPKNGFYTETKLSNTPNAAGDGNLKGAPFVLTGSITQTRSGTLKYAP